MKVNLFSKTRNASMLKNLFSGVSRKMNTINNMISPQERKLQIKKEKRDRIV